MPNWAVMNWFTSYLSSWLQHVRISTTSSALSAVSFGVPQGSVLEPILFLLYSADLLQLISRHLLHLHTFADNPQIYGFCKPSTMDILCQNLSPCVNDVLRCLTCLSRQPQFPPTCLPDLPAHQLAWTAYLSTCLHLCLPAISPRQSTH